MFKLKQKINKLIIFPKDYRDLFKHSDLIDIHKIEKVIKNMYLGMLGSLITYILVNSILILILSLTLNSLITPQIFFSSIAILVFINIISSIFLNYTLNINRYRIFFDYLNTFIDEYLPILPSKMKTKLREFYSTGFGSAYNTYQLGITIINFTTLTISLKIMSSKTPQTLQWGIIVLIILSILAIAGYFTYIKPTIKLRETYIKHQTPPKILYVKRSLGPAIYNIFSSILLPIASIGIIYFKLPIWTFFLTYTSTLVDEAWGLLEKIEQLILSKKYLKQLNIFFHKLESKFIFNEKTYDNFKNNNKLKYEALTPPKSNGLILQDFSPINHKKNARKYNYLFTPNIYKIIGTNGIGKTTLLKSLALTNDYLTEKPSGIAWLNKKPLFGQRESLKEHRELIIFLSKNSKAPKLKIINHYKKITSNNTILNALKEMKARKKSPFSEGETAILHLLNALLDIPNNGVIIVDELLSRIHDGSVYPIRSILINLIRTQAIKKNLIILIVDHAIEIKGVIKVNLTKKRLVTENMK